jgi:hypothetical protein
LGIEGIVEAHMHRVDDTAGLGDENGVCAAGKMMADVEASPRLVVQLRSSVIGNVHVHTGAKTAKEGNIKIVTVDQSKRCATGHGRGRSDTANESGMA